MVPVNSCRELETVGWADRSSNCTKPFVIEIVSTVILGSADPPALLVVEERAWRRIPPSFWLRLGFPTLGVGSVAAPAAGAAVVAALVSGVLITARKFKV